MGGETLDFVQDVMETKAVQGKATALGSTAPGMFPGVSVTYCFTTHHPLALQNDKHHLMVSGGRNSGAASLGGSDPRAHETAVKTSSLAEVTFTEAGGWALKTAQSRGFQ